MKLYGRVIYANSKKRVRNALVAFDSIEPGQPERPVKTTDVDGTFTVDDLPVGTWKVHAFHADGRQIDAMQIEVNADGSKPEAGSSEDNPLELNLHHYTETLDQDAGKSLFRKLIIAVLILVGVWSAAHIFFPNPGPPTIASDILHLTAKARHQLSDVQQLKNGKEVDQTLSSIRKKLASESPSGGITEQLQGLADPVAKLERILLKPSDRAMAEIADLEADIEKLNPNNAEGPLKQLSIAAEKAAASLKNGNAPQESKALQELVTALGNSSDTHGLKTRYHGVLQGLSENPDEDGAPTAKESFLTELDAVDKRLGRLAQAELAASPEGTSGFLWSKGGWLLLEIYLWALFATLLRLIFIVHIYLRENRFFRQGLYQHYAMIATIPFFAVAFVYVVSMVKLTGENAAVVIDMSDPRLVAGTAFLIALVPWVLWDRLREQGRKTLGQGDAG